LFAASSLAIFAVASPAALVARQNCDTGSVQCCNTLTNSTDPSTSAILGLIGAVVSGVDVPIGLECNPITVIGAGANGCSASPVCCENTNDGLVGIGCVPVDV
ncbi:fungal hydrophobin, partial [Punctularia strigosozonata HHB-11173 SS5]